MCRDPDQELPKEYQASFQSTFNIQFNDLDSFLFNHVVEHMTGRNEHSTCIHTRTSVTLKPTLRIVDTLKQTLQQNVLTFRVHTYPQIDHFKINTTHNLHFKSNTTAELGPTVPALHRIIAQGAHISTDWLL